MKVASEVVIWSLYFSRSFLAFSLSQFFGFSRARKKSVSAYIIAALTPPLGSRSSAL